MSNCFYNSNLFFFDDILKYPYLRKRGRKPTETLPIQLQEVRASAKYTSTLENYFKKQKGTFKDKKNKEKKKEIVESNSTDLIESVSVNIINHQKSDLHLNKVSSKIPSSDTLYDLNEDEDDNRFLFEEAKFSATSILLQLGKYLEKLKDIQRTDQKEALSKENNDIIKTDENDVLYHKINSNTYWQFNNLQYQAYKNKNSSEFIIPDFLISLLKANYQDLIENAELVYREWQTQTYRDIINFSKRNSVKNIDSGIFSAPPTAMSGLYLTPAADDRKKRKKSAVGRLNPSHVSLHAKSSNDSGMTSGNEGPKIIAYRKESKFPKHKVPKAKTRYEKYCNQKLEPTSQQTEGSSHKINIVTADQIMKEKEDNDIDEVPVPPINQQMISFAISSKTCHEKGWVKQPSLLDDPEQHTLLAWCRARLQQSINQREKEEQDGIMDKQQFQISYYGDSKLKPKQRKNKKSLKDGKKQIFMVTLNDGSMTIFYPSGKPAVVTVNNADSADHNYMLIYADEPTCNLLAYFTPTGRGACFHPDGKVGFLSSVKFGSCQDENGALLNKWKWTKNKLIPPLSIQLSKNFVFRCSNKNSMFLVVNINGEAAKLKLLNTTHGSEPNLSDMGYLQTKYNFISSIAIQLSKAVPSKKDDKRNRFYNKKEKSQIKLADDKKLSEEELDNRMKDLQIKFPCEMNEREFTTPYQNELKKLQTNFKTTVATWLEHYRIATGLTSPVKVKQNIRRNMARSAVALTTSLTHANTEHMRAPSAPPIYNRVLKSAGLVKMKARPFSSVVYSAMSEKIKEKKSFHIETRCVSPALTNSQISVSSSKTPFKAGMIKQTSSKPLFLPREGCPIAFRAELLGDVDVMCKCDKRKVPVLCDIEYDGFLTSLPKTQLVVISIVSSKAYYTNPADVILEKVYRQFNNHRSFPCTQCYQDPYRLFRYVIPEVTSQVSQESKPLLVRRHNVIPGMFMMYQGSKLLFADYIFDGYGNSKKDFIKQISRTRKEALKGHSLPSDFQFSPSRCKRGPRTPWGGQIGAPSQYNITPQQSKTSPLIQVHSEDEENSYNEDLRQTPTPDSMRSTNHDSSQLSHDSSRSTIQDKEITSIVLSVDTASIMPMNKTASRLLAVNKIASNIPVNKIASNIPVHKTASNLPAKKTASKKTTGKS